MNSSKVEQAAVNEILRLIEHSDYLQPYIATADKEPSWDGHIYLYNDPNQYKKNFLGRVPVQVKGRSVDRLTQKNSKSFSIEKDDLKNYENSFGVIYFLVEIHKDENKTKKQVFYSDLLPLDLSNIDYSKENNTVSIQLKKLSNIFELETIIHLFLEHQKRQASGNLLTAEDSKSMKVFSTYNNSYSSFEMFKDLLQSEQYIYGSVAGVKGDLPIKKGKILPGDGELQHIAFDNDLDYLNITYHKKNDNRIYSNDFMLKKFEATMNEAEEMLVEYQKLLLVDSQITKMTHSKNKQELQIKIDNSIVLTFLSLEEGSLNFNIAIQPGIISKQREYFKNLVDMVNSDEISKIKITLNEIRPDENKGNTRLYYGEFIELNFD